MAKLFVQCLTTYNNENLSNSKILAKVDFIVTQKGPKIIISPDLVTLVTNTDNFWTL